MTFMIIEIFREGKIKELYQRFSEKGRQLPAGVTYVNSWIDENVTTCYQVMESDAADKIKEWTLLWEDVANFTIIPVISSAEAKRKADAMGGVEKFTG
ncbi:MAG TPA: DUF3303 family protein [Chitinophagaceae bacterium]|nr:DUF3303 family protein [Chitinophagaceae bacterium]